MRNYKQLIVLGLIGVVLAGLIVPAVHRIQDAANRGTCHNNLLQIVLGLHNYQSSSNGEFLQGTIEHSALPPEKRLSWYVDLLPYMGEGGWLFDREKGWEAEENRLPILEYNLKRGDLEGGPKRKTMHEHLTMLCPAAPDGKRAGVTAFTHFVGVAGVGIDSPRYSVDDPRAGVFGYDRQCSTKRLAEGDGQSTTLIVIETRTDNGPWVAGGPPTVRGLVPERGNYLGEGGQFTSGHRMGVNAAFADGTVVTLSRGIDANVLQALMTMQGHDDADHFESR